MDDSTRDHMRLTVAVLRGPFFRRGPRLHPRNLVWRGLMAVRVGTVHHDLVTNHVTARASLAALGPPLRAAPRRVTWALVVDVVEEAKMDKRFAALLVRGD